MLQSSNIVLAFHDTWWYQQRFHVRLVLIATMELSASCLRKKTGSWVDRRGIHSRYGYSTGGLWLVGCQVDGQGLPVALYTRVWLLQALGGSEMLDFVEVVARRYIFCFSL